ncbi:MAG: DUF6364 family protein [Pseudomonadota bacterium]
MSTNKLTLSIDAETVKKAKRYVAAHGTSLSRLLTQYLASLPDESGKALPPSVRPTTSLPVARAISGKAWYPS